MILDRWRNRRGGRGEPRQPVGSVPEAGLVSVVVPLYNHERFIGDAIESVLAQGPVVREIVVVDDGSSDASASVVEAMSRREPRILFWSQPNRGAHAAINAGLLRATGEVLAILNSDDAYMPGRLAALTAALDADREVDLAASGLTFLDGEGGSVANPWHDEALQFFRSRGDMALALVNGNFLMTTSNYVFRRTLLDEIGLFAGLRYAHDLDFALRVLARGRRVALLETPLLRYRMHPGNTIREDHAKVRLEWAAVTAFFLTSLWDRPGAAPVDWRRAMAIEEVLDGHRLTRAVHLCMTYFRRHASGTLSQSPFLSDTAFQELVQDCL